METMTVERGPETTYHTNPIPLEDEKVHPLPAEEIESMRVQIQEQIQAINQVGASPLRLLSPEIGSDFTV